MGFLARIRNGVRYIKVMKKGKEVFYASINKGKIKGVHKGKKK